MGFAFAVFEGFVGAPEGVGGVCVSFFAARVEGADPGVSDQVTEVPEVLVVACYVEVGEKLGAVGLDGVRVVGVAETGEIYVGFGGSLEAIQDVVDVLAWLEAGMLERRLSWESG